MKDLLRDDFMDDPSLDPDYDNCPIKLPLSQATQFFIKDEAIKEEGFKVKTEPQDFADQNSQVSSQNVVTINGETKLIKEEKPDIDGEINGLESKISSTGLKCEDKKSISTINRGIVDLISCAEEDKFFQLQLPNCMPMFNVSSQSRQPETSQANNSEPNNTEQPSKKGHSLRDLPAGKVGKIQIMKSGRTRLVLGNTKMWLETGTQVAFNQELVGLDLDKTTHSGAAKCLGSVGLRMMVCPDWDWLVSQTS
ncbi:DNA-directed RNA polymerase III subunit RPC4 isoform X1 [Nilaparvata lugens]|uniref:DNA-directed RNA polymerase III subunit RPC4 isoform X1 n=1 Tax=Nilaparvata lugens TaxID=108931 RepID=UPI00193DF9FB|nr:DNA-directed RNA polymerase III subunit RPC4 isoform X1 [Nilaparvata lugens]